MGSPYLIEKQEGKSEVPPGISERIFADPDLMVRDAVESIDANFLVWRYIIDHPEAYREPLKKLAQEAENARVLFNIALLGYEILTPREFIELADRATAAIPDTDHISNVQARKQLSDLVDRIGDMEENGQLDFLPDSGKIFENPMSPSELKVKRSDTKSGKNVVTGSSRTVWLAIGISGLIVLLGGVWLYLKRLR